MLSYLLARLKEPSTYAGLGGLLAIAGVAISPEKLNAIIGLAVAAASAAAVFLPDAGKPQS